MRMTKKEVQKILEDFNNNGSYHSFCPRWLYLVGGFFYLTISVVEVNFRPLRPTAAGNFLHHHYGIQAVQNCIMNIT